MRRESLARRSTSGTRPGSGAIGRLEPGSGQADSLAEAAGDPRYAFFALNNLTVAAFEQGENARALELSERNLALARKVAGPADLRD